MNKKVLTKKEVHQTFKKINDHDVKFQKYRDYLFGKENRNSSFEKRDIWIVSDSSTSFVHFDR